MKLTDKQKKKIIADYVECQNYSAVARRFKVSRTTVQRVVAADNELCEKVQNKKDENTQSILDYMDSKSEDVKEIIGLLLSDLKDEGKRKRAGLMQTATTLGIVIDKFTAETEHNNGEEIGVVFLPAAEAESNE